MRVLFFLLGALFVTSGCGKAEAPNESFQINALPTSENHGTQDSSSEQDKPLLEYRRKEGGVLTHATDLFGPLIVKTGDFYVDLGIRPWTGSWLPMTNDSLFRDASSPLQKYDQYVLRTRGKVSRAAEFERENFYFPNGMFWTGRCDAWAIASVMEPEPKIPEPVTLAGITFTTDDLKALLVLSYQKFEGVTQFGQRNNGDAQSIREDIYPDQLHKILQRELFERKRALIMDRDAGVEVWNTPIYQAFLRITADPSNRNVLNVEASLKGTQALDTQTFPQANIQKNMSFFYEYQLYGYPQPDGTFKVRFGIWKEGSDSVENHPDFLWTLPDSKGRQSKNTEIEVEIVDEIIQRAKTRQLPTHSLIDPILGI